MVNQTIPITERINAIVDENLNQKYEEYTQNIDKCKECRYFDKFWVWGRNLYCCACDSDNPSTSRDTQELYDNCPIDHKTTYKKGYIKRYGIIHEPPRNEWDCGVIKVVDFRRTHFESDGYNPTIDYDNIVIFFYRSEKEKERMMKLAIDYYDNFNLDIEWVEKRCYG